MLGCFGGPPKFRLQQGQRAAYDLNIALQAEAMSVHLLSEQVLCLAQFFLGRLLGVDLAGVRIRLPEQVIVLRGVTEHLSLEAVQVVPQFVGPRGQLLQFRRRLRDLLRGR